MMQDIGRWLVIGLVVAALITTYVPEAWFTRFMDRPLLEMLLVLVVSVPMYLCATGSIPIAVALMMKGLSPGAALVLLMAGPASNAASLMVVRKVMGLRTLLVYLFSISLGAIAFGLIVDMLPRAWFTSSLIARKACCMEPGWVGRTCAVVLFLLLVNALVVPLFRKRPATATLYIKGMHCNHCAEAVEKALRQVDGITDVSVSLPDHSATLTGTYSEDDVHRAIESIGFKIWTDKQ